MQTWRAAGGNKLDDQEELRYGAELAAGLYARAYAQYTGRAHEATPSGSSMSLQLYYDHTYLSQRYPASPAAPPFYTGFPAIALTDELNTDDAQFQYQFTAGVRQQFVWGVAHRATQELDEGLFVRFVPPRLDQNLYSGFLQDQITLLPASSWGPRCRARCAPA